MMFGAWTDQMRNFGYDLGENSGDLTGIHAVNLAVQQKVNEYFRYCPGEERVKLSDAVCFGRRRTHFPKCKGCQFNDDEQKPAGVALPPSDRTPEQIDSQKRDRIDAIFKSYDVRGLYPD